MNKKMQVLPKFFGALALPLLLLCFPQNITTSLSDENAKIQRCNIENKVFQAGEEVTYKVYYNWNFVWIPAGEVVFKVKDFGAVYQISATGRTYSSYEWFFKVRDRYESYVDKESLLPNMSVRDVKEGGYTLYDKTTLNQKTNKAHVVRGRSKEKIKEDKHFTIDECMHDILSVIYYARNLDYDNMEKGTSIPVKIFMDKEEWPLKINYGGKAPNFKIKGVGKFNAVKFSPEVIAGDIFGEDGSTMNVWATDDKNRIPLLIESEIAVGSIKVILEDYKGLKYDFDAKIDD